MNPKILFLDSVHPVLEERLSNARFRCEHDYTSAPETICSQLGDCFGIVIRSRLTLDKKILDSAPALKFIARSGSGLENVDVDYARSKGITIFNSPEGNRDAVAEHAIGMLLMLFNNLKRADEEVRHKTWRREENRGLELKGKTIGIVGYGTMGSGFAEKLAGFGCRVIAYDKYKTGFGNALVEQVGMKEIFSHADVVSLHVPLTAETHFLADEKFFTSYSKPIFLVNTSRGAVVKTSALVQALASGKVRGACLDVLEYEESSFEIINLNHTDFEFLASSANVLLSPHIAGWTVESYFKLSDILADKILDWYYKGSTPQL